jgi:hypothetical protein
MAVWCILVSVVIAIAAGYKIATKRNHPVGGAACKIIAIILPIWVWYRLVSVGAI